MPSIFSTLNILLLFTTLAISAPTQPLKPTNPSIPSSLLPRHSANTCTRTEPETCTLWIRTNSKGSSTKLEVGLLENDVTAREWAVYDSECQILGGGNLNNGYWIDSRGSYDQLGSDLHWTVDVRTDVGNHLTGSLWYKGRRTDLGDADCGECVTHMEGFDAAECCRVGFDCS